LTDETEIAASPSRARRNVVFTAAIAALGGLLFGYDTGIIASALLFIKTDFDLSSFQQGMVVSAVPVGAIFGAAIAGQLSDKYGRRKMILLAAGLFIAGSIVSALAPGATVLITARVFIGFAIGLASATCPVYISEVAPAHLRGRLVTLFQLAVTVGILVAYLVGLAFEPSGSWEGMLAVGAIPAFLLGAGILAMPQSPRWLVMIGDSPQARHELLKLRPDEAGVDEELHEIERTLSAEKGSWKDMRLPAVKAALVVGVGLAVLQQVTGINTVIYYAPTIVQDAGINSDSAAILASIGVGVVNVAATVWALYLVSRHGRRPLLVVGVSGMVAALILLGISFEIGSGDLVTAIAIGSLMLYVAAFAISLGPIFWILNSEIYPLNARGHASGVGTMANWGSNFLVSLTFLPLINLLGSAPTFWFYAAVGFFTIFFCLKYVPETKGLELEEIEEIFEERAAVKAAA
jgi:SP family galactose:H+ symporter-like MFS transporter